MNQTELKEWRVIWQVKPYMLNQAKVLFVKAKTYDDSVELAKNWVEREKSIPSSEFSVISASLVKPVPEGEVLTKK